MPPIPTVLTRFWAPYLEKYKPAVDEMLVRLGHAPDALIGLVFVTPALHANRTAAGGCVTLSEGDAAMAQTTWPKGPDPYFWSPGPTRTIAVIVPLLPPGKRPPA